MKKAKKGLGHSNNKKNEINMLNNTCNDNELSKKMIESKNLI